MTGERLVLVPLALGHVALFVLIVNVVHSFGHHERVLSRVKLGLLAGFVALSSALALAAWNDTVFTGTWPMLAYGVACVVTGLVAFPAATAWLHHRPRPDWTLGRETLLDLAAVEGRDALVGHGGKRWLLGVPGNQSFLLRKVEWEVPITGLPKGLDGLSVVHLSDLHLAPSFDRRFFERVIEEARSWPCDLVAFTGDLVDDDEAAEWVVPLLSRLRGRLGSYAIMGNHDLEHSPERLRRLLVEAGFTDLEGAWATTRANGLRVALGGTSFPWGPPLAFEDRPAADFSILLSHAPDLFYRAERAGIDLMLSGHNHGGQVRLPLVGPVFMPSRYSRRFDRGFFQKGGLTLHVSQGIAGKHPIRIGCPPEIGRLVLRSVPSGASPRPDDRIPRSLLHDPRASESALT
jgi:predicted MPP superfamily phosphohydrolase